MSEQDTASEETLEKDEDVLTPDEAFSENDTDESENEEVVPDDMRDDA